MPRATRLCLVGAPPDTGNLGVSALCFSVLGALAKRDPTLDVTVFDGGRGVRSATTICQGRRFQFVRCGASNTRRYYRPESLWNIRVCAWLGGLGNPAASRIRAADAILDISGGDSFGDLYGLRRFRSVALPKLIALEQNKPLLLLPQTYGPYRDPQVRRRAREIVCRATLAWSRDARSFETLKALAGADFDPRRYRCGVDVAFALEARRPERLPATLARWLEDERAATTIGFNLSGLIFNDPQMSATRYGLRADYRAVVTGFLRRVLRQTDARVLLVPHVLTPPGHYESDIGANEAVLAALGDDGRDRLLAVPPGFDQSETKWIISRLDWLCGTRMHATIAGLSSGVPTAAIAYSLKTQGVFETCEQGSSVADMRALETEEAVAHLWRSFEQRVHARAHLAVALPKVQAQAESQMDEILASCVPEWSCPVAHEVSA